MLLSTQPLPRGRRVAVLTNAGGLGILCADACEAAGLELPTLEGRTRSAIANLIPREASLNNPIDVLGSATPRTFEDVIPPVLADNRVDAVIVNFVPLVTAGADEVAAAIERAVQRAEVKDKPVLAVMISEGGIPGRLLEEPRRVAAFADPDAAARALSGSALREPSGSDAPPARSVRRQGSSESAQTRSSRTRSRPLPKHG